MTDAALQSIAAAYSTPTFVFDADALQARVRAIEEIFGPDIALCYSIKANPFLLHAMSSVTARLEVCSPGELSICEQLHAADARVISSAPWQTVSAATRRNPFCRCAICKRPPSRRASVFLYCFG